VNDSQVPLGCVVIRLDDLVALLAGRAAAPPAPRPPGASWPGLAVVVALLTARLGGIAVDHGVTGDVPPETITGAAVMLAGSLLAALVPSDMAVALLRDLGLLALSHAGAGTTPPAATEG